MHILKAQVLGILNHCTFPGSERHFLEVNVLNGTLVDAGDRDCDRRTVTGYVFDVDVAKDRRFLHQDFLPVGTVIHIQDDHVTLHVLDFTFSTQTFSTTPPRSMRDLKRTARSVPSNSQSCM